MAVVVVVGGGGGAVAVGVGGATGCCGSGDGGGGGDSAVVSGSSSSGIVGRASPGRHLEHKQQSVFGSFLGLLFLCQSKHSEKNLSPVSSGNVSTSWKGKLVTPACLAKLLVHSSSV